LTKVFQEFFARFSGVFPQPAKPFFVHSDLTTAVQLADIVAYCFNRGARLNKMTEPTRPEIQPFAGIAQLLSC
jgi:hypothetical protein